MKRMLFFLLLVLINFESLLSQTSNQGSNLNGYISDDNEVQFLNSLPELIISEESRNKNLPSAIDNSKNCYFRPIFWQGNFANCVYASAVGYIYTYEVNRLREIPSNDKSRQYPLNFHWNYINNGNSTAGSSSYTASKLLKSLGVPNSNIWEEVTGDPLTGNHIQWMNGYEKYYSAMKNRLINSPTIVSGSNTLEKLELLKYFLYDHGEPLGDTGGLLYCIIDSHTYYTDVCPPNTPHAGKILLKESGTSFNHAVTLVGYDDTICYDFNGDGSYTNDIDINGDGVVDLKDYERGALIIANSAGNWFNNGFVYFPYKLFAENKLRTFVSFAPKEEYSPEMTIKVNLQHDSRKHAEIRYAISENAGTQFPTYQEIKPIYPYSSKYAGVLPFQGVNNEPIEIGVDISETINDLETPKKYYFLVQEQNDVNHEYDGTINSFSIYDYRNNNELCIKSDDINVAIADNNFTYLSLIYDIIPEQISSSMSFNHNIGIPYNSQFSFDSKTLTFNSGSKLYFHNSIFAPNHFTQCIFEGNTEFIGWLDELSDDKVMNYSSNFVMDGETSFSNCDFILGNTSITTLEEDVELYIKSGSELLVKSGATLKLKEGSELFVESGATITIEPGAIIEVTEGARIKVIGGTLNASNVNFTYTSTSGYWYGIKGYPGSHLSLTNINMSNLRYAVSGSFNQCDISNCSFISCGLYGINLVNTNDYNILNNTITGTNTGKGIYLTQSNGDIKNNIITNFDYGVYLTSSSPLIYKNTIRNNDNYGLYVTGYNSYPQLLIPNPGAQENPDNNTILNNGINYSSGAQICLNSEAKIYLNQGCNNIYSTPVNQTPAKPCIKTYSSTLHRIITINAENNYWGAESVSNNFFNISSKYDLDYTPYSTTSFPHGNILFSDEGKILREAIANDNNGDYTRAQSSYEALVTEYPNSKEAYVASAMLPANLNTQGKSLNSLINSYEEKISNPQVWNDTKFFEEMIVSGKMASQDYATALAISETMKEESTPPHAKVLASIDIAISKSMIDGGRKGGNQLLNVAEKQQKFDDMIDNLDLYAEMLENGTFRDLTDENPVLLPTTFSLSQNYPNPFNPNTTIAYSLPTDQFVSIKIFNIMGKEVANLVNGNIKAGMHTIEFNGNNFASGQYFYKIETKDFSKTRRMLLIK